MPILKREPDAFPEDIFDLSPAQMPWQVAYVRSRQEKHLARHLHDSVPYYLPQWEQVRSRSGRRFSSWLPLFSGYFFFRGAADERRIAIRSNVVVHLLDIPDQERLHEELSQLYRLQQEGGVLEPWAELAAGDEVVVRSGPFEGYRGVIVKEKEKTRLIVSIQALRQSVSVELGRESVRPAVPVGNQHVSANPRVRREWMEVNRYR
ncbi:MAG TPA: transcription termination/antitermination NusG family protein [Rhodothermales bacterium]|nr:transcription termination/antitermination NusG family protein [Rhodothermales bacterium]